MTSFIAAFSIVFSLIPLFFITLQLASEGRTVIAGFCLVTFAILLTFITNSVKEEK